LKQHSPAAFVLELNRRTDGHPVLRHLQWAVRLLKHRIATTQAKRDHDRIRKLINAFKKKLPSISSFAPDSDRPKTRPSIVAGQTRLNATQIAATF
jgi:hypothetical protein